MQKSVVFKKYHQHQISLLPPSKVELIPENHPSRVVNDVLNKVDISKLEKDYKGGVRVVIIQEFYAKYWYLAI